MTTYNDHEDSPSSFLSEEYQELAKCVEEYESKFQQGVRFPDLVGITQDITPEFRNAALLELSLVDMERRWQLQQGRAAIDYLQEYVELANQPNSALELTLAEYNNRLHNDPAFNPQEFRQQHREVTFPPETAEAIGADVSEAIASTARQPKMIDGRYRVLEELGTGGFGAVYRCQDTLIVREVAVKLQLSGSSHAEYAKAFLHEARAAARIEHENIVRVYDTGHCPQGPYIVFQLIEGQSLARFVRSRPYSIAQAVDWVASIAEGLHLAHTKDLVHRDIKMENILIDNSGKAYLTDFGLASVDRRFFCDDKTRMGSWLYMSPEVAAGRASQANEKTDIYSLGVVLYALLTRKFPFEHSDATEVMRLILETSPTAPGTLCRDIPKTLDDICLQALEKEPRDRPQNALRMAEALRLTQQKPPLKKTWLAWFGLCAGILFLAAASTGVPGWVGRLINPLPPPLLDDVQVLARVDGRLAAGEFPSKDLEKLGNRDRVNVYARSNSSSFFYVMIFSSSGQSPLWNDPVEKGTSVLFPAAEDTDYDHYYMFNRSNEPGVVLVLVGTASTKVDSQRLAELKAFDPNFPTVENLGLAVPQEGFKAIGKWIDLGSSPTNPTIIDHKLIELVRELFEDGCWHMRMFAHNDWE